MRQRPAEGNPENGTIAREGKTAMTYFQASRVPGRHFLHVPGPSNVPDRVLRAIDNPTMDHRSADFGRLGSEVLENIRLVFQTRQPVIIYPSSGTGAWEAALVNTLSPGDHVLMCRTGWFANLWQEMAEKLGLVAHMIETDWRGGADVAAIGAALAEDHRRQIKAVCVVHNETSTGCTSDIASVRRVMDAAHHPALLLVDSISSLGSMEYRHDEWGVDVTVCGSQKGLMMPPGLGFNAPSEKALKAAEQARLPRSYWSWQAMTETNATGFFPYTPAINLLYGLNEALKMLLEEGLANVFARHARHAEATRRAMAVWGLENQCADPARYSASLTAVRVAQGHSADALRRVILERFNLSLGTGLGILKDRVFRIGHLGDLGDLQLIGVLAGVEMGLAIAGIPHEQGGAQAAMGYLGGHR